MKTYIFLYQEVSLFEVDLVAYFFKTKGEVYIVTEGDEVIHTNEGIRVMADKKIGEICKEDIDVLVICGGYTENIKRQKKRHSYAICAQRGGRLAQI